MRGVIAEKVADRARRFGPLRFDEVLEMALYDEADGFYATGSGAGRGRDFLTAPEVGPLFGAVVARALDRWWDGLGAPDPFIVVECGAGSGALAASILAAVPRCLPALRYVVVERSPAWRDEHARRLPLEPAGLVLGPAAPADPELGPQSEPGVGPLVASVPQAPVGPFTGVILANELLDNLAFRLVRRRPGGWEEVRVGADVTEVCIPAPADAAGEADRLVGEVGASVDGRIPLQHQAAVWLRGALASLAAGRVAVFDYADSTPGMAQRPWLEWVRTYRSHGRGGLPLDDLGDQDVTCEVAVDQLAAVRAPTLDRSQADFLRDHGIDDLVEDARRRWLERAAIGDLEALKARSRIGEGAALVDPAGLGRFRVLEWVVPGGVATLTGTR